MRRQDMKSAFRAAVMAVLMPAGLAHGVTWGTFGGWDSQARRDAADASMRAVFVGLDDADRQRLGRAAPT